MVGSSKPLLLLFINNDGPCAVFGQFHRQTLTHFIVRILIYIGNVDDDEDNDAAM